MNKRECFLDKLNKTWNICDPNTRNIIENDSNRSKNAIEEDLAFYDDNFGPAAPRKLTMRGRGTNYDKKLLASLLSEEERKQIKRAGTKIRRSEKKIRRGEAERKTSEI